MKRNAVRRGAGVVLVAAVLGIPGLAAAEPAGPARIQAAAELGLGTFWTVLVRLFQADQVPPSGTGGGEGSNGGGAMDPNGGPKTGGSPKPGNP
ncbi:MAG TPA: hypothetical protein VKM72_13670 [Thermoanaerobaculia bacterium]|nr:hypothetical protein [Thermoanaerobaculia bacterium]